MGSSYARESACFASRRIDSVWFESTHKRIFYKIKKRVIKTITLFFWWKRVGSSYAREFACYASRRIDSVWFESTHKRIFYKIKKRVTKTITLSSGGRGWIRTTEVIDDRFTVCSLWPLGNSSILFGEITEVISLWSW